MRSATTEACPACGFYIGWARVQYRGALHYWRYFRSRRWVPIAASLLWFGAACFGCWLVSFSPGKGFVVLTAVAGLGVVGMGRWLTFRKQSKN